MRCLEKDSKLIKLKTELLYGKTKSVCPATALFFGLPEISFYIFSPEEDNPAEQDSLF